MQVVATELVHLISKITSQKAMVLLIWWYFSFVYYLKCTRRLRIVCILQLGRHHVSCVIL